MATKLSKAQRAVLERMAQGERICYYTAHRVAKWNDSHGDTINIRSLVALKTAKAVEVTSWTDNRNDYTITAAGRDALAQSKE